VAKTDATLAFPRVQIKISVKFHAASGFVFGSGISSRKAWLISLLTFMAFAIAVRASTQE
jgi:hypothetical protein